ncbi:MAG: hypothetical protein U9N80_07990, partial [Chloroflexota bacterium]|nr:hypothetical protein [Chloroflexota bacterium]
WGDPGLFLFFISFGGQSIGIRRYSLLELRIRSLLAAFHTAWRDVSLSRKPAASFFLKETLLLAAIIQ